MRMKFTKIPMGVLALGLALGLCGVTGNATVKSSAASLGVKINEENFPDSFARDYVENADRNNDGYLSTQEAKSITNLTVRNPSADISKMLKYTPYVKNLYISTGTLTSVVIGSNNVKTISINSSAKTAVALKQCKNISEVYYYNTKATSLDLKKADGYGKVKDLFVYASSKLKKFTIPNASAIEYLSVSQSGLSKLDTKACKKLKTLNVGRSKIKSLNLNKNKALTSIQCYDNKLTSLSITGCTKLKSIGASGNKLKTLNTSKNKKLDTIVCSNNKLTSIDVSKNTALKRLEVSENSLKKVAVNKNKKLEILYCRSNKLATLSLKKNTKLTSLSCEKNKLKSLGISNNKKLQWLTCGNNKFSKLSTSKQKNLSYYGVGTTYALVKKYTPKNNTTVSVEMKSRTFDVYKNIPALKGYTLSSYYGDVSFSNGKVTVPKKNKKYTAYYYISAKKGNKTVYISMSY